MRIYKYASNVIHHVCSNELHPAWGLIPHLGNCKAAVTVKGEIGAFYDSREIHAIVGSLGSYSCKEKIL